MASPSTFYQQAWSGNSPKTFSNVIYSLNWKDQWKLVFWLFDSPESLLILKSTMNNFQFKDVGLTKK